MDCTSRCERGNWRWWVCVVQDGDREPVPQGCGTGLRSRGPHPGPPSYSGHKGRRPYQVGCCCSEPVLPRFDPLTTCLPHTCHLFHPLPPGPRQTVHSPSDTNFPPRPSSRGPEAYLLVSMISRFASLQGDTKIGTASDIFSDRVRTQVLLLDIKWEPAT